MVGETEPAPHSRREVFSLRAIKVAGEERGLLGRNPPVNLAEKVILQNQGVDLFGGQVNHGGRVRGWGIRLPPVNGVAEVEDQFLDLALGVVEGEGQVLEAFLADKVGTDAVEHHGGTESFFGRILRFGDPLEGSTEDLTDPLDALVASLREGLDVVNGMTCVGVLDVVFGYLGCIHPPHAELKKGVWCSRLGATFQPRLEFIHSIPLRKVWGFRGEEDDILQKIHFECHCLVVLVFPVYVPTAVVGASSKRHFNDSLCGGIPGHLVNGIQSIKSFPWIADAKTSQETRLFLVFQTLKKGFDQFSFPCLVIACEKGKIVLVQDGGYFGDHLMENRYEHTLPVKTVFWGVPNQPFKKTTFGCRLP